MLMVKEKWFFTHIKVVELFGDCNGTLIDSNATSLFQKGLSIDHKDGKKETQWSG